jgi:predicted permease
MSSLLQDLSQAVRGLRKRPGFAIAALLTLALGIGANVTVFSLVNAMLLRPLPFGDRSDRVVTMHSTHRLQAEDWGDSRISYRDLVDVAVQSSSFDGVGGFLGRNFTVSTETDAERVLGGSVTPNLFPLIGVEPMLGRNFTTDEGAAPGLESSVILTHGLWQRRFGADPGIVGKAVIINERARVVVGVMPQGFKFPERAELYMPLRWDESPRQARSILAVGVLKHGVSLERAQAEVDAIALRLQETYPESNRGYGIRALTFRDSQVGADERLLSGTLMAAVGFVLLIACANLANLLLVRGAARQREMAVRAAMGASRVRLAWTVISESAVIAAFGTLLGTLAAIWALDLITASLPEELPFWMRVDVDQRIVVFAVVITAFTTLAIGLLPALRASRPNVISDLKEGNRGMSLGPAAHRVQALLVVGQVALCLALLVGANLMIRSFLSMQRADLGFDDRPLLTMRMYLAGDAYDDVKQRGAFFVRAVQALRELPGVTSAVITTSMTAATQFGSWWTVGLPRERNWARRSSPRRLTCSRRSAWS